MIHSGAILAIQELVQEHPGQCDLIQEFREKLDKIVQSAQTEIDIANGLINQLQHR